MAQEDPLPTLSRIDGALDRIEAAIAKLPTAGPGLAKRHAALRSQIEQAVAALDALIGQSPD